jgi:hypothetical protein
MAVVTDSPRYCDVCKGYGDHHTDRHDGQGDPRSVRSVGSSTVRHPRAVRKDRS